jgi:hypothetical protein
MSVRRELFETSDVWTCIVLVYLYGIDSLAKIEDQELPNRRRLTTYSLAVPSEDAKIVQQEYESGQLALSDAKAFVAAYRQINSTQRHMREHGESQWVSERWIRGEVG